MATTQDPASGLLVCSLQYIATQATQSSLVPRPSTPPVLSDQNWRCTRPASDQKLEV